MSPRYASLILAGSLALAGCASTVTQEKYEADRRKDAQLISELSGKIDEAKKSSDGAQQRYGALLGKIDDLNSRLSVSSIDNYAVALEDEITTRAQQYAHLARTMALVRKSVWKLGDDTAASIDKLRADTKGTDDSLAGKIEKVKADFEAAQSAYDDFKKKDYAPFKENNEKATPELAKRMEAYETQLAGLARLIRQYERQIDPSKISEETGDEATEYAYAELRKGIAGLRAAEIAPVGSVNTKADITSLLDKPADAETIERVLGIMALGTLTLDEKTELYSKGVQILSSDAAQKERLYGTARKTGMLAVRDALLILRLKSLAGEQKTTIMDYVNRYTALPNITKAQTDTYVLLGLSTKTDIGEALLTFTEGKLTSVQTAQSGTFGKLLEESRENYRTPKPTGDKDVDAFNQRCFERDLKEYRKQSETLKSTFSGPQLQERLDILHRQFAHLFEEAK